MAIKTRLPIEKLNKIKSLHNQGWTPDDIASETKISRSSCRRLLIQMGLAKGNSNKGLSSKFSKNDIMNMKSFIEQGVHPKEIAEKYAITTAYLYHIIDGTYCSSVSGFEPGEHSINTLRIANGFEPLKKGRKFGYKNNKTDKPVFKQVNSVVKCDTINSDGHLSEAIKIIRNHNKLTEVKIDAIDYEIKIMMDSISKLKEEQNSLRNSIVKL